MTALLLWCFAMQLLSTALSENSYFLLTPKQIRPGLTSSVLVRILKATGPVKVEVSVIDVQNKTIAETSEKVFKGKQSILQLKIPTELPPGTYRIRSKGSGGLKFSDEALLNFAAKASSIFIQTDKAVYRPGEKVLMKAVGTYSSLRILHAPMDVVIYDPQGNRIKQWLTYSDPVSDVFKGELQLTDITNTGEWKISIKQLNTEEQKSFEVREFVLPRFEVTLTLPSYGLTTDEHFTGKVTATYTFGKPVKGELVVVLLKTCCGLQDKIELRFKDFTGESEFQVLMSDVTLKLGTSIRVDVTVVEGLTGQEISDTGEIRLYDIQERIVFAESLPRVFKPGLTYNAIIRVTQPDGEPLPNARGKVKINVTYQVPIEKPKEEEQSDENTKLRPIIPFPIPLPTETKTLKPISKSISKNGVVEFKFSLPSKAESATIMAMYMNATSSLFLSRARSPSETYLQVRLKSKISSLKVGKQAVFTLKATEAMTLVEYQVLSKTKLADYGVIDADSKKSRKFSILLTQIMAPRSTLIVSFVRTDGEIVSDSLSFTVEGLFENDASIKFNKKTAKPNSKVVLNLKADPESEMHVLAIDKKVVLLKTGNDFTQNDVLNDIQLYNNAPGIISPFRWWWWFPIPVDGTDTHTIYQNAGVVLMTDLTVYRYREPFPPVFKEANNARQDTVKSRIRRKFPETWIWTQTKAGLNGIEMVDDSGQVGSKRITTGRIRKKFPETWIWTEITSGPNGKAKLSRRVPDSITTWVATMFAANPKTGLGVAPKPAEVTVFLNQFLEISIPRSAIRKEIIVVQVDFFNYGKKDQNTTIILKKSKKFYFSDKSGKRFIPDNPKFGKNWAKSITIKAGDVDSVFFPIIPLVIGDMDLIVSAKEKVGRKFKTVDAVKKPIKVKAEGVRQSYSIPLLINLPSNVPVDDISITFPENHVAGSEFIQMSAIGDIMGPSLSGIEDLLQMSYGCGEQNLLRFVPNVFITSYLQATNRLTDAIKAKAEAFLTAGYQRELQFLRTDGSFSAFGNRDKSGSTWLTAFVVKSFAQAKAYTYIDPAVMGRAIKFLLNQQRRDGSFQEPGVVLHKSMQGGSTSSVRSLATFVLIALVEAKQRSFVEASIAADVDVAINETVALIVNGAPDSLTNTYELGIALYGLSLLNKENEIRDDIAAKLEDLAENENGMKYWTIPDDEENSLLPWKSWHPPRNKVKALDIEVTAYILLAFATQNDTLNGLQILKWLISQQNPNGGFVSTQDTVVALQALAAIAKNVYKDEFGVTVRVKSVPGAFSHTFKITDTNALVLQIAKVPYVQNTQNLTIDATGNGFCLLEVSVYFNVEEELRVPAFDMSITLNNETIQGFKLDICFRWLRDGRSTMALLNIAFPTGMGGDFNSTDTAKASTFKKAERVGDNIVMYFDYVSSKTMCVGIKVFRHMLVALPKKVPVTISDYYEPANTKTEFYMSKILSDSSLSDVCGERDC